MGGAGRRDAGGAGRRRGLAAGLLVLATLPTAASVPAGTLDGRIAMEMEYLGESYFSEQLFTAEDLGLPAGSSILVADTTRFHEDTWLPGQRLEFAWQSGFASRRRFSASSRSAVNRERWSQDLEFRGEVPAGESGRWRFLARGALRDDDRSLVGHGDWQARLEATREFGTGTASGGGVRVGWDHSRTRGDTTSYLYDYDTVRARVFLTRGSGWLPRLESFLEGWVKDVPAGEPGGYREVRLAGAWRDADRARSLTWEGRIRDVADEDGVGRDLAGGELAWRDRVWNRGASSLHVESEVQATDYAGEDDLYYDSVEVDARLLYRREGEAWTVFAGPAVEVLADLGGEERDYWQWTGRGSASRLFGLGGLVDMSVEAGYRNYRSGTSEVIEVASLSTSLLRSDYWLVEALAIVNIPIVAGVTLDAVASTSWEFHTRESERIQVTFATVGVERGF